MPKKKAEQSVTIELASVVNQIYNILSEIIYRNAGVYSDVLDRMMLNLRQDVLSIRVEEVGDEQR